MKLEYFNIDSETRGNGPRVTLGFSFQGSMTPELVADLGRRIEAFLRPLPAIGYQTISDVQVRWVDEVVAEPVVGPDDVGPIPPQPEPAAEDNLETIESTPEPVAEVKPAIRRNRGKMLPPVEVPSAPVAGTPLRVRGKPVAVLYADTEPVGETPAAEPAPAPAPRRTRTPAPEAEPEITDIELAKAASEAAAVIPLDEVKAVIAAMGVSTVNQIEGQEKRKDFLYNLRHLVEQFTGGVK